MRRLDHKDLQVLRAARANIEAVLPSLVEEISAELYAHPEAAPFYTDLDQVRGQSRAWIVGVLASADLDALDLWLTRVAAIHRALGIPAPFFVEVCALICDQVTRTARRLPLSEGVRLAVVRTFTRILFRQAALYGAGPAPASAGG